MSTDAKKQKLEDRVSEFNSRRAHRTSFDAVCDRLCELFLASTSEGPTIEDDRRRCARGKIPKELEWMQVAAASIDIRTKRAETLSEPARLNALLAIVDYRDRAAVRCCDEFDKYNRAFAADGRGGNHSLHLRLLLCQIFIRYMSRAMLPVCDLILAECRRLGVDTNPVLRMRQELDLRASNTLIVDTKLEIGCSLQEAARAYREAIKPFVHAGLLPGVAFRETLKLLEDASKAGDAPQAAEAVLGDASQDCLTAMLMLGATCSDNRRTAEEIVVKAGGPAADVNTYKRPLKALIGANLARAKLGRGGGYWLTAQGTERARR